MATESDQFLSGGGIPKLCGVILAGGKELPAVPRESDRHDRLRMPFETQQFATAFDLPNRDCFRTFISHELPADQEEPAGAGNLSCLLYTSDAADERSS